MCPEQCEVACSSSCWGLWVQSCGVCEIRAVPHSTLGQIYSYSSPFAFTLSWQLPLHPALPVLSADLHLQGLLRCLFSWYLCHHSLALHVCLRHVVHQELQWEMGRVCLPWGDTSWPGAGQGLCHSLCVPCPACTHPVLMLLSASSPDLHRFAVSLPTPKHFVQQMVVILSVSKGSLVIYNLVFRSRFQILFCFRFCWYKTPSDYIWVLLAGFKETKTWAGSSLHKWRRS